MRSGMETPAGTPAAWWSVAPYHKPCGRRGPCASLLACSPAIDFGFTDDRQLTTGFVGRWRRHRLLRFCCGYSQVRILPPIAQAVDVVEWLKTPNNRVACSPAEKEQLQWLGVRS
jgi:hypothetical protein